MREADGHPLPLRRSSNWFGLYKPFGWEVLDLRYGGLITRLETMHGRISAYLDTADDSVTKLSELEVDLEVSAATIRVGAKDRADLSKIAIDHLPWSRRKPHARLQSMFTTAIHLESRRSGRVPTPVSYFLFTFPVPFLLL